MGQIADDIIDGSCCAFCLMYFEDPEDDDFIYSHGYPVACKECWEPDCGYEKATANLFTDGFIE